jgi:hypothetical protein
LKKPRSCAQCRAYTDIGCRLGHKQIPIEGEGVEWNRPYGEWETFYIEVKPEGECEKPLTVKELVRIKEATGLSWHQLWIKGIE